MMTKRSSLGAIAGLVSGMWLAGSLLSVPPASAQSTQTEVKSRVKQGALQGKGKWQSATPEQQESAKATGKADIQESQAKWQSATPEAQQQAKDKGVSKAQEGKKKWQSMPK
jgi:hypothetical protein